MSFQQSLFGRIMSFWLLFESTLSFSQTSFLKELGGLQGYFISTLATNQQGHIFAATSEGIFSSQDNGETWTVFGLSGNVVERLAFNSSGYVYAVGAFDMTAKDPYVNFFCSIDNGRYWTRSRISRNNAFIHTLVVNLRDHIFVGTTYGVFRSTNNGKSWDQPKGLPKVTIKAFVFNSRGNTFVATETIGGGVYRSTNNGLTWTFSRLDNFISQIVINPRGHIFAKAISDVFRSIDNGRNWTRLNLPEDSIINSLAINSLGYIYAGLSPTPSLRRYPEGIFCSKDNGETWTQLTTEAVGNLIINSEGYLFATRGNNSSIVRSIKPTTSNEEPLVDSSCADEVDARSQESVFKTNFIITNRTALTLTVYWLDYQGHRQEQFKILSNQALKQDTFEMHKWLVADPAGKCLRIFEAPAMIVIE